MRTPSPPYCRLDLAPPLADRFIFGVAPIDYGPVLLLMPFGFHLAMDTLPSGNCKRWLQVRLGCIQLSPSCPFRLLHTCLSPGPRGITPAFGYGAPHPSARGTSTLLINALLSAHYSAVRILTEHRFPFRFCLLGRLPRCCWGLCQSSKGHALFFRTVPSANTLVRWVNENAFASMVQARPCPTFGLPVHLRGSPHRLRPGTSPHALRIPPRDGHPALRELQAVAPGPPWLYPAFAFVPV